MTPVDQLKLYKGTWKLQMWVSLNKHYIDIYLSSLYLKFTFKSKYDYQFLTVEHYA